VVATSYLLGVSTRRVEKLIQQLGITSLSKSQVSEMARDLDAQVEAFRTRPLDAGPCTFAAADALVLKVREAGRTVNVHALLATGVNAAFTHHSAGRDPSPGSPSRGTRVRGRAHREFPIAKPCRPATAWRRLIRRHFSEREELTTKDAVNVCS
jgi:hypothetical protein